ncbi:uncharacterized protein LAJ45_03537 [Morchella importuna]|uniref:uncharacterized protein n=1 Tax=Morchella importuna TaxID=1174673 RepID=UPI001E8CDDD1|nr:uncharacterized protein LAJ45_03537 [Morchella importuna]KAH8152695.1 hypothetical protein LAJ45_03537 [Morchella importuna]
MTFYDIHHICEEHDARILADRYPNRESSVKDVLHLYFLNTGWARFGSDLLFGKTGICLFDPPGVSQSQNSLFGCFKVSRRDFDASKDRF